MAKLASALDPFHPSNEATPDQLATALKRWPEVLESGRPALIAAYAGSLAEHLPEEGLGDWVPSLLWQALDALGPGPESVTERAHIASWLCDYAIHFGDLALAWNVAARMVLSDYPHEEYWGEVHHIIRMFADHDPEQANSAFNELEKAFLSPFRGKTLPWDIVDGALGEPYTPGH